VEPMTRGEVVLQKCWWYGKLRFISRRAEGFPS
jgi:hypothetical protein